MYFVRRSGRVKGPFTQEKLRSLRQERRLRMRDEISLSKDGPWQQLRDVRERVLGDDASALRFDSDIWSEEPVQMPPSDEIDLVAGEPDREWQESLQDWIEGEDPFRKPFRPWMYALGGVLLVALAILSLAIVFGTR